jgi:hypothetical protein
MDSANAVDFIRHPAEYPYTLRCITPSSPTNRRPTVCINGGIRIGTQQFFEPGSIIEVETTVNGQSLCFSGQVLWSKDGPRGEMTLIFDNPDDAFKARMAEQLCHIKCYQQQQQQVGRHLDDQEAANEWISQYSPLFPKIGVSHTQLK